MPRWVSWLLVVAAGIVSLFGCFVLAGILLTPTDLFSGASDCQICAHNLREIFKSARLYQHTSGDRYFPHSPGGSLASLELVATTDAFAGPQVFVCPAGQETVPELIDGRLRLTEETCSYQTVPWKISPDDAGAVLAYDRRSHRRVASGPGRFVVYTDGSVQFLLEREFQALYERQRARFGPE